MDNLSNPFKSWSSIGLLAGTSYGTIGSSFQLYGYFFDRNIENIRQQLFKNDQVKHRFFTLVKNKSITPTSLETDIEKIFNFKKDAVNRLYSLNVCTVKKEYSAPLVLTVGNNVGVGIPMGNVEKTVELIPIKQIGKGLNVMSTSLHQQILPVSYCKEHCPTLYKKITETHDIDRYSKVGFQLNMPKHYFMNSRGKYESAYLLMKNKFLCAKSVLAISLFTVYWKS